MAQLWELLEIEKGLTAVMGSGGKTGLLYELAEELRPYGTVLLATTTHIMRPDWCPFAATAAELCEGFAHSPIVCAGSYNPEGKLTAPDFPGWQTAADFVLVEADGSKRLPAKAHAAWEPVLPPERNRTVCVFGASALGQPIQDAAHRPELYASLAEVSPEAVITPAIAARVLAKEGGFDVLFINQADVLEDPAAALQPLADTLPCPAIYGALAEGYWAKLSLEGSVGRVS